MELPVGWKRYLTGFYASIFSVILGFIIGAIVIAASGANLVGAYSALIWGAFGSPYRLGETLAKSAPFMLAGLGFAVGYKAGFWNIGTEGQIIIGTIFALWAGIAFTSLHPLIHISLLCLAGFVGAGIWCLICGVLKAKFGLNEIITTLMTNYMAFWLAHYLVHWPWDDPNVHRPQTVPIAASAAFPTLITGTKLHIGIVLSIIVAILIHLFFKKTPLGYEMRLVGLNPSAAKYSGIDAFKVVIIASFISGGLAGLAGV
ncbi:MAG: ABC transporter permease [Candidatus Bathyarchaeia archaeon]